MIAFVDLVISFCRTSADAFVKRTIAFLDVRMEQPAATYGKCPIITGSYLTESRHPM